MRPRTLALWGAVIRGTSVVGAGVVLSVLVPTYVHSVQNTIAVRHLQDFGIFYESAKQARSGGDMYDVTQLPGDVDTRTYWNLNPPHFHLLILPFTFLSPPTAFLAWLLLSAATLLVSLVLICRALQLRAMGIAALSFLVVVSAPMMLTLMTGQIGPILLLPVTLAWHCARQGRYALAGAWIGASASIKPFFLLFVVCFALLRRWRAAQMACLTLLGMFAIGLALFGLEAHRAWINHLSSVSWAEHYVNASVLGFVERTFSISEWQQIPIVNWPWVVGPVWLLAGGGICVATLWRVRHVADPDRQFLLTATASLLVSPVGWVYYAWFLIPPLAAELTSREKPMPAWRVGLFGVGIASLLVPPPVPSIAVRWGHGLWTATLGSVYFWGLFALWIVAWIQLPQASVTFKGPLQEDENTRSGSATWRSR